jgi:micrococcal nuclease
MRHVPAVILQKTLTGKVIKIADGDTLTLLVGNTQVKVRLEGIDTPERGSLVVGRCRVVS